MKIRFLCISFLVICFGCTKPFYQQGVADAIRSSGTYHSDIGKTVAADTPRNDDLSTEDQNTDTDEPEDIAEPEITEGTVSNDAEAQRMIDQAMKLCDQAQRLREKGERDKALESLDKAFLMILKTNSDDNIEILEQKEELRFLISKRILEIYASRNTVSKGTCDAIPIIMNSHVKKEIEYLSKGNYFAEAYRRSGAYRPFIEEELRKAGLPKELAWLPLIESGYNVKALSPARALGLWQFIPSTGYKFGLNRDKYVDERMDPEKSTKAAIAYLKELHNMFGDWSTVLAAYNCGEGRVLKVIRSQNVNYLDNFWDLYEKLPNETARYVPRFLATLHIISHPDEYGLKDIEGDAPLNYEEISIRKQLHLKDMAAATGISLTDLKKLNPELKQDILPPVNYTLKVPVGNKDSLLAKLETIPESSPPKQSSSVSIVYHRIRKGDTLSKIAKRYGTTSKKIMGANKMHRRHYLVAGNILKIPSKNTGKSVTESKQTPIRKKSVSTHIVRKGDSLWNIARKYGISTSDLRRANKTELSKLSIGQELIIPADSDSGSEKKLRVYKVRNGDVPMEIAKRHNMSLDDFLKVNRMTDRSRIFPGQKLYVE